MLFKKEKRARILIFLTKELYELTQRCFARKRRIQESSVLSEYHEPRVSTYQPISVQL